MTGLTHGPGQGPPTRSRSRTRYSAKPINRPKTASGARPGAHQAAHLPSRIARIARIPRRVPSCIAGRIARMPSRVPSRVASRVACIPRRDGGWGALPSAWRARRAGDQPHRLVDGSSGSGADNRAKPDNRSEQPSRRIGRRAKPFTDRARRSGQSGGKGSRAPEPGQVLERRRRHGARRWAPAARMQAHGGRRAPAARRRGLGATLVAVGSCLLLGSGAWLLLGRRLQRVKVAGTSMEPELEPGDRLLVWRTRSLRPGDIVAAHSPRQPGALIVKRLALLGSEGAVLLGDNVDQSTDSRQFGAVPSDMVIGRAIYRYMPAGRAGHLTGHLSRKRGLS